MSKAAFKSIVGVILGSLIEEGLEEMFPGLPELGYTGEALGGLTGFMMSELEKEDFKKAWDLFLRVGYRLSRKLDSSAKISEEDLQVFSERFGSIPKRQKQEMIESYRLIAPYEYSLILDFFKSGGSK